MYKLSGNGKNGRYVLIQGPIRAPDVVDYDSFGRDVAVSPSAVRVSVRRRSGGRGMAYDQTDGHARFNTYASRNIWPSAHMDTRKKRCVDNAYIYQRQKHRVLCNTFINLIRYLVLLLDLAVQVGQGSRRLCAQRGCCWCWRVPDSEILPQWSRHRVLYIR